jgi:enoyl-CoA hydratase/carnithine racemase
MTCSIYFEGDDSCFNDAAYIDNGVWQIQMRRESVSNAMGSSFWTELPDILELVCSKHYCRCIVLRGLGKNFSAGLDLNEAASFIVSTGEDSARDAYRRLQLIRRMQLAISAVSNSPVPVIACVQGACVGGGIDLITVRILSLWFVRNAILMREANRRATFE